MRVFFGALIFSVFCFNAAHATDFSCPKPMAIPDAWNDVDGNGTYDPGTDIYDPVTTGYSSNDAGQQISLHLSPPYGATLVGGIFPVDFPALNRGNPISGGNAYRQWIAECAPFTLLSADTLLVDSGNLVGPTNQGIDDLIMQDPSAYWDGTIVVSSLPASPRVITLLVYDPSYGPASGRTNVVLVKFLKFFIESRVNGLSSIINGRIVDVGMDVLPTNPSTWGGLKSKYKN